MIKKVFISTFLIYLFALPFLSGVSAYTVVSRETLGFDESLYVKDQEVYAFPEKILIARVEGAPKELSDNSGAWLDMLYYHFVTRLEFADLPYNYLFDRQGDIYQGRTGFEGVIPELAQPDGVMLLGYLSNGSDVTGPANQAMKDLVEDLSYKYGIEKKNVQVVDIYLADKGDSELSKLDYEQSLSIFAQEVEERMENYEFSSEDHVQIEAEVSDLKYSQPVDAGKKMEVTLKITNVGDEPWFTFNDYIYIVTANGEDSEYAVNQEWDSFSTPGHVEGETIFPEESADFKFNLQAPFFPGDYQESFGVKRLSDTKILDGTKFDVKFAVNKGDLKLVEILDTETGALNVRATPSYNGQILAQVPSGETFVYTEEGNGWYKIKYEGEETGWIYGQYAKKL